MTRRLARYPQALILLFVLSCTALGGVARIAGSIAISDGAWLIATVGTLIPLAVVLLRDLLRRKAGVDVVALLALVGALVLREYLVGAVIAVMYAGGRALESYASAHAERELRALLERAPRIVHRYEAGELHSPPLESVMVGDLLLVMAGEVVPVDGLVEERVAVLDESALTGEPGPVERQTGERVRSGSVNAGPPFDLRATSTAAASTYAGILRLVQEAQTSKAPFVRLADRYALAFVPLTLAVAGVAWIWSGEFVRALAVLVVATPCPLILAAPVAIVAGISRAARRGIVIKGGGALETLGRGRVLLLDKTGTLTAGRPVVTEVVAPDGDADELLRLAASLDQASQHVLAEAIVRAAYENGARLTFPQDVTEELGRGLRGTVDGREVAVGKAEWVSPHAATPAWVRRLRRRAAYEGLASVFAARDGRLAGAILLDDPVRADSPRTLRRLRRAGIRRIVMVTGDRVEVAATVGAVVGVDEVLAERAPAEKVEAVQSEREYGVTVMVGDGVNDAPALAAADVGVAMGARGATASSEAADVVLVLDRLDRLADALEIAHRTRRIALQSVVAGMGLSVVAMLFAAAGMIPPVAGAVLQEAIDIAVILNALRALGGGYVDATRASPDPALSLQMQRRQAEVRPLLQSLRTVADSLDRLEPAVALAKLQILHSALVNLLLPHEAEQETTLFPLVTRLRGNDDTVAGLKRMHVEIAHLTRVLGRMLEDIAADGFESADLPDLRRLLYGLSALVRLHVAQEEEEFSAMFESTATDSKAAL